MDNIKNLTFFNKKGENYNFNFNKDLNIWEGNIYLSEVSVNLFETEQIIILEKVLNLNTDKEDYTYPIFYTESLLSDISDNSDDDNNEKSLSVYWETSDPEDIKLFSFSVADTGTQTSLSREIIETDFQIYDQIFIELEEDPSINLNTNNGLIETYNIKKSAIQIDICIHSKEENTFKRTLVIKDVFTDKIIAKFTIYGETIEEDERLRVLCENLGYNITKEDPIIFKQTDVNEQLPNELVLNQKRKEILLEGHNIFPYIGSYKALINAIKFYGFNNLKIKEFWRNIDSSSKNFGKYIYNNVINIESDDRNFNDKKIVLPSKKYKKTNLFSLIYRLNTITDKEDPIDDLPVTEEVFDYSTEEVLIKLFGLKNKLEKDFLILNQKIISINGEADFFSKANINTTLSYNEKITEISGVNPCFDVYPNDCVYLSDIRELNGFCEDFGNTQIAGILNDVCDTQERWGLNMVGGPVSQDNSNIPLYTNRHGFGPDPNSILGDLIDGSGITMSDISNVFSAYFSRFAPSLNRKGIDSEFGNLQDDRYLPDKPNIPIGGLVTLKNCSFSNISWEDVGDYNWKKIGDSLFAKLFLTNANYGDTYEIKYLDNTISYQIDEFPNEFIVNFTEISNGNFVNQTVTKTGNFLNGAPIYKSFLNIDIGGGMIVTLEYTYSYKQDIISGDYFWFIDTIDPSGFVYPSNSWFEYFGKGSSNKYRPYEDYVIINEIFPGQNGIIMPGSLSSTSDFTEDVINNLYNLLIANGDFNNFYIFNKGNSIYFSGQDIYKIQPLKNGNISSDFYKRESSYPSWDTFSRLDFVEIEWTIRKEETPQSPSYSFNIRGSLDEYENLSLILPYIGYYDVELKLYDMYNRVSSKLFKEAIKIEEREVEFSGWYRASESRDMYRWDAIEKKYTWEDYAVDWELPLKPEETWEDATVSWYEGLDTINAVIDNFDQNPKRNFTLSQIDDLIKFGGPYIWENMYNITWENTHHLWWGMLNPIGDRAAYFEFNKIQPDSYLKIIDINGIEGEHYFNDSIDTLEKAVDSLYFSTDPIIKKYNYNIVFDSQKNERFVQAVSRYYGEEHGDFLSVDFFDKDDNVICDTIMQKNTGNVFFDEYPSSIKIKANREAILERRSEDYNKYPVYFSIINNTDVYLSRQKLDFEPFNGKLCWIISFFEPEDLSQKYLNVLYNNLSNTLLNTGDLPFDPNQISPSGLFFIHFGSLSKFPYDYYSNSYMFEPGDTNDFFSVIPTSGYKSCDSEIQVTHPTDPSFNNAGEIVDFEVINETLIKSTTGNQIQYTKYNSRFKYFLTFRNSENKWLLTINDNGQDSVYYSYDENIIGPYSIEKDINNFDNFDTLFFGTITVGCLEETAFTDFTDIDFTSTGDCPGLITRREQSVNNNPTWYDVKFINDWKELHKYTWIMFVYDKCRILGKDKPKWTIKNLSNPGRGDIYFEGKYLTYLFKYSGNYSITLELEDSNKNKYIKEKNILTIK